MKKLLAIIGVLALLFWIGWRLIYALGMRAVDAESDTRVSITIPAGSSTAEIAQTLEDKDIIRSPLVFKAYVKKAGLAGKLQAGSFVLQPSMTPEEVAEALTTGKTQEMPVTVPEGYTVEDIDELLAKKGLIEPGDFIACANSCDFSTFNFLPSETDQAKRGGKLEGYLYPDTYFVAADEFVPKFFAERMLGTFRSRVLDAMASEIRKSGRTVHEVITMASLIEEETRTDPERALVSGILWKRFDEGMGLYVDASNRYIADKPTAALTAADLDADTPYNLRKYRGLPPGPIANPSVASIEAALHPESSPYYYYLHGTDGQIRYAVTNDEHNANKARYLR